MTASRYKPDTLAIARAALARGSLTPAGTKFAFGRRRFDPSTIAALIAAGDARRLGDGSVIAAREVLP